MFQNIFRKYDFQNLYVGVVTVYKSKGRKPSCVKVEVPPGKEQITYVTILNRIDRDTYLQIDNQQYCFYSQDTASFSNYPVIHTLMPLSLYYEKYYGKDSFFVQPLMTKRQQNKIIKHVSEKVMVI